MRHYGCLVAVGLMVGASLFSAEARAQVQDDAALAEEPRKPPPVDYSHPPPRSVVRNDEPVLDSDPALTTTELRKAYPDLQLRTTPGLSFVVCISAVYPFQPIGLGVGADAYVLPRLRASGFVAGGVAPALNDKWKFNLYADASFGIVLWRHIGEATVELPAVMASLRRPNAPDNPFERAIVPTSHSLELEAGMLTGYYQLYRCKQPGCEAPVTDGAKFEEAGSQFAYPYAGVRYVYYRWASSKQAAFRSVTRLQIALDVLTQPFKTPDSALFDFHDKHVSHSPVGARLSVHLPGLTCTDLGPCFGVDLSGGYLPTPSDVIATANLSVY